MKNIMKNIIKNIILIKYLPTVIILVFGSCTEADYGDKYADPSKISDATCDKLMTGAFNHSRGWIIPSHDGFNWGQRIGVFAQTFGTPNQSPYSFDSYGTKPDGRWDNFYSSLINFRAMENLYAKMSDAEKAENNVFMWVTQIFIYQQLTELAAAWGNVPYTEASTLLLTGDIKASTPKYDSETDLYNLMIDDLIRLSDNLRTTDIPVAAATKLVNQDYINGGDILQWRKFANSLILRLGIRLSSQGALVEKGKSAVSTILGNETNYPLPADNSDMVAFFSRGTGDLRFTSLGKGDESRILGWGAHAHVSRLVNDNDPRLEVLYDPVSGTNKYVGFDFSKPYTEGDNMTSTVKTKYSRIDSTSFISGNDKIPAVVFSAPEIWFLKAEAYQRGIVSGNAEAAFKKAVDLSVKFYYDINAGATSDRTPVPLPDQSVIDNFVNERWNAYPTKEEAIATQKWIHFGYLQEFEAWTELRRTGMPRLFYSIDQGAATSVSSSVPNRLRYPDNERIFNDANCPRTEDDKFETVLIWAKSDWHDEAVVE
jgi:hypothetical protein